MPRICKKSLAWLWPFHIVFTAETNFFTLSCVGVTIPRLQRNGPPMQVISYLGTSFDFSLFTISPSEAKRWRHLSRSWHKTCLNWFNTNQLSRYQASLMLWARRWAAATATIFVKHQGDKVLPKRRTFHRKHWP